jgi:hypothetical protein
MTEEEYFDAGELWDEIMLDVESAIKSRLKRSTLTQAQKDFLHEKCVSDLYHAGWSAFSGE